MNKLSYIFLFLLASLSASAQTFTLKGTVKETNGTPLLGATIVVKESHIGTSTDMEGHFSIKAQVGQTLEVSYVGMKTQRFKIKGETLQIILQEEAQALEGVVLTGYQKIQNRVFTGAAASVKMDNIKMEGVADISRMLEGRVAGLSIQNVTGSFGSAPRINIRGGASIIGNVQPLWVIDGAIYEDLVPLSLDQLVSGDAVTLVSSAIAGLNATDIEDIQVLKDASATSMYGARALNGVIVITTKSGKRDTPNRITYSYEQSFRTIPSYKDFDLLNSQETMSLLQEMNSKGYFNLQNTLYGRRSGIYYQWYKGVSTINPNTGNYYYPNTPAAQAAFMREREYANTDWFKHLFSINPIRSHTITFSGGGKNSTSYASLGYYHDSGWTITDNVKRITANLKNTFYINDQLKATFTAVGNLRSQKAPGTFAQRKNTAVGAFERDFDINPFSYALGTSRTLRPKDAQGNLEYYRNNWAPFNILEEYRNNYMKIDVLDFKVQAEASYKVNPHLEVTALVSARQAQTQSSHYITENSNVIKAFRANETPQVANDNIYLLKNKDNPLAPPQIALTNGGIFNKTETSLKSYMGRLAVDYHRTLREDHDLKAFGFAEIRYADRTVTPFQGYGIQYDRGNQVFTNPLIFQKLLNEGNNYFALTEKYDRGITFSASGTYGYKGKYIANAVLNYEGSNTAGRGTRSRWLPTWNVGAKWNIDREDFFNSKNISTLALRASYGLTAKMNEQAINSYSVFQNYVQNRYRFSDRENALRLLHLENRDLTWEKMYELNLGVDAGFFDNRISMSVDVYQRNSFDLIDLIRTSGIGGEYYKYANFGDMRTRGIELSLNTKNIQQQDFQWATTISFSYMNQKITRLLNTPNTFDMVSGTGRGNIVGYPKGSLFSFNYQGVNHQGLPTFDFGLYPLNNRANANVVGADFLDTQYSKSYLIYHGSVEPNVIAGLSNTFTYKNWEASFFISAQAGNKIRLNPTFDPTFGDLNVFPKEYYNRWLHPYDELRTEVPSLPSQSLINLIGKENIERAYNTYNYSQNRVADGSFVRMKSISLGYRVPKKALERYGMSSLTVRAQATNPFLIYSDSKLNGQDPEYYKSGGVSLPTPKQYTLAFQIGF
ncbi:SusC/RagA family TonB-linked outer membrane protein [Capnocytophaga sp. oral taxon 326]|uniref:SusC/RagA family TonB-linked outer membrane protein n=1 Tax=Capnocytophaga sp. oral taxon 326 TaxID=712212 RepID=UPI0002A228ED|nr:SusC/RagA family TonB-linked outer membrane protein [Capnocytophaga sp. oral taxon 326]EKY10949.1 TonB-dependent receptor plug domain protein [Capnocytophaga sp. oral taxon 326 str. F0382]